MYLKEMRIFGPPALIFYDRNGNEIWMQGSWGHGK